MNKQNIKRYSIPLSFFILMAGFFLYYLFSSSVMQKEGVVYSLRPGISKATLARELAERGVVAHPIFFSLYGYAYPFSQLKSGEYWFPQGGSAYTIWRQVMKGAGYHYHAFTIVPGWSFAQVRHALLLTEGVKHTSQSLSDQQIMARLHASQTKPEGEFFPETYYYARDVSDITLLRRAYDLMQQHIQMVWLSRSFSLPYHDAYEMLIAASLIEKEAHLDEERPLIAGVLVNRLQKNMLLQMDPTVIYGMGERYTGTICKKDLSDRNPYNTYIYKGLPPTPIASPSLASMIAVVNPNQHHYYYFVAKGDGSGSHYFSESLNEHHLATKKGAKHKSV